MYCYSDVIIYCNWCYVIMYCSSDVMYCKSDVMLSCIVSATSPENFFFSWHFPTFLDSSASSQHSADLRSSGCLLRFPTSSAAPIKQPWHKRFCWPPCLPGALQLRPDLHRTTFYVCIFSLFHATIVIYTFTVRDFGRIIYLIHDILSTHSELMFHKI